MQEAPLKVILSLLWELNYKDLFMIASKINEHIYTRGVEDYINNKLIIDKVVRSGIAEKLKNNKVIALNETLIK